MMTMKFSVELSGDNYSALEIDRASNGTIRFNVLGMNDKIVASGVCEPEELMRMAEILAGVAED